MTVRRSRRPDRASRRSGLRRNASTAAAEPVVADGTAPAPAAPGRVSQGVLLAFAREMYNVRRRRIRHLPADLFGEPTWDILLDLYVATRENRSVPTTSACIGAHVPPTTALRWLRILEARGLVEREEDGRDGRRTFVRLSPTGLAAMEDWMLAAIASLDQTVGTIMRAAGNGSLPEAAE